MLRHALGRFWRENRSAEEADETSLRILTEKVAKRKLGKEADRLLPLTDQWLALKVGGGKTVLHGLTEFVHRQGLERLSLEIAQKLGSPSANGGFSPEEARRRLEELCFSFDRDSERAVCMKMAPLDYDVSLSKGRIPTGIRPIDDHLRGGLGQGQLGVILAPPGGGKTTALVNIAARASQHGVRVFHLTLEIGLLDLVERFDMHLSGRTSKELPNIPEVVKKARKSVKGDIVIQDLSHEAVSCDRLETLIKENSPLGLITVDYADLMIATQDPGGRRFELGEIYRRLRRMASHYQVPIWTASQTNRESIGAQDFGLEHTSEDISKVQTADAVLCLIQTPAEKIAGIMRVKLGKTRASSQNPVVPITVDYDRMYFGEREEELDGTT